MKQVKAKRDVVMLQFWKEKATPKVGEKGVVLGPARWLTLAMLARAYRGIDGTSCQVESNFSSLALTAGGSQRFPTSMTSPATLFALLGASLLPTRPASLPNSIHL